MFSRALPRHIGLSPLLTPNISRRKAKKRLFPSVLIIARILCPEWLVLLQMQDAQQMKTHPNGNQKEL